MLTYRQGVTITIAVTTVTVTVTVAVAVAVAMAVIVRFYTKTNENIAMTLMENNDVIKTTIWTGVTVLALGIGGFWFLNKIQDNENMSTPSPANRSDLRKTNTAFDNGEDFFRQGKVDLALQSYKEALTKASNQSEEESIKFRVALTTYRNGDTSGGLGLFKQLIAMPQYSGTTKAYAIQFMSQEYLSSGDNRIFEEIFSGVPYSEFYKTGEKEVAIKNLLDYGLSFRSLPILELRRAEYDVNDLVSLKKNEGIGNDTTEKSQKLKSDISAYLDKANRGTESLVGSPNIDTLPVIYNRKAMLFRILYSINEKSFGDPEVTFKQALDYANLYDARTTKYFIIYNYAAFLANYYGESKTKDIEGLLSQIYNNKELLPNKFVAFMRNKRTESEEYDHKDIVLLSSLDSSFKDFLIGIGWTNFK